MSRSAPKIVDDDPDVSMMLRWRHYMGASGLLALSLLLSGVQPVWGEAAAPGVLPLSSGASQMGLLWEVATPCGRVNYLFGTMHSADPRITTLPSAVRNAFDGAERVVLELDMTPKSMLESAHLMMYQDGGLADDLPPHLLEQVRALAAENGWPPKVLEQLKPWAVAVSLSAQPRLQGEALDQMLATQAREQGKSVFGLETVPEQLSTFDSLPLADQIRLVQDVVDEHDRFPIIFRELEQAYLARDLPKLLELGRQDLDKPDAALAEYLLDKLLDGRNWLMLERVQPYLRQGGTFVAIGALHLPGEDGLLQLLQVRGYSVRVVY
jgi:uncharacterized protein YbaP (TraB family)